MRLTPSAVLMWKASVPLKIWIESAFIRRANLLLMTRGSKGLAVLEKEAKRLADQFFQERKTEESARLKAFAEEVKQSLTQWKQMSVLDGLAPYFYDRMVSFAEYFPKEALVVLDEPNRLWEEARRSKRSSGRA